MAEIETINGNPIVAEVAPESIQPSVDAWLAAHPEATTTVQDGSITDDKLVQSGGVLTMAKDAYGDTRYLLSTGADDYPYSNLLNKDSTLVRTGVYVNGTSGAILANADYTSYVIAVVGGKTISVIGMKWAHISFCSQYVDIVNVGTGTIATGYISGTTTGNNMVVNGISVPSGAKYAIISLHTTDAAYAQVSYGATTYGFASRSPYGMDAALDGKADAVQGKNILDLTKNNRSGIFVNGTSGFVGSNSTYSTCILPVTAGDVLSFNSACSNAHVSFLSTWYDVNQITVGAAMQSFIAGFANSAQQGYTVPSSAVAMIFSYQTSRANLIQVERASASTSYEPYWKGMSIQRNIRGILPVGAGMTYSTISDAVAVAGENDIILVYPGTYTETVKAWGKFVNIVGISRDECILTYGGGDYSNPPLEMSHGTLANITIRTTYETQTGTNPAYCMHVEDSTAAGSSFHISNVRFVNDQHQTVGIGLRNNYTITFENCLFENNANNNAFYCHDYETTTTGLDNQNIQLVNCTFVNNSPTKATIALQSQEIVGNRATLRAQRCIVRNLASTSENLCISMTKYRGRDQGGGNFLGSTDWLLDGMSALNTLTTVNAF